MINSQYSSKNGKAQDVDIKHGRQAVAILAKRASRFVLIRHGSKLPLEKGWNRPENTRSASDALAHLATGGSVGHAAGSGHIYWFDFDRDAERGHECSQLTGGFAVWRANAPDKAKFAFTCDAVVPTRPRSKQHGFDLLGINKNGTHTQAVIAGKHPSGDLYQWSGHTLPHLHIDTVAALYAEWTDGEELFPTARENIRSNTTDVDADLSVIADALSYIDPWTLTYTAWLGVLGALHDTYGDAAFDLAVEWGDGGVEERWDSFGDYGDGGATLASIFYRAREAGWVDTRRQRFHEQVLYVKAWLDTPAAASAFADADIRYTTGRKIVDALADLCAEWGTQTVRAGLRLLALRAAMGVESLRRNLPKLAAAGLVKIGERDPEKPFDAVPVTLVFQNDHSIQNDGTTVIVLKNYSDHRCDDAFRNNHAAYKRRMPDGLAPLGETALVALVELLRGDYTAQEIAGALGVSVQGVRRGLNRAVDYGMVTLAAERHNRKRYSLVDTWRDDLSTLRRNMTTAGVHRRRLDAYNEARLESAKRSGDARRIEKASAAYNRIVGQEWTGSDPAQWVDGRRRSARTWMRWDKTEEDRALAGLRAEVQKLRRERVPVHEIRRMMSFAGHDPADVSRALAYAGGEVAA